MQLYGLAILTGQVRQRAGLTQAELARRSGISQSVISAYENGRREPGVGSFMRLAAAAGLRLDLVEVSPLPREAGGPSSSPTLSSAQLQRNAEVLRDVLDLADRLPASHQDELSYPSLSQRPSDRRR